MQKYILIDFDGTIADTFEVIASAISELSTTYNFNAIPKDQWNLLRNLSFTELFAKLNMSMEYLPALIKSIQTIQAQKVEQSPVFPGMDQFFNYCKNENIKIFIVTSSNKTLVENYCAYHNIIQFIDKIYTAGMFNKDVVINSIREEIGHEFFIYVGDEVRDIEAAHRANIPVIACTWGLHTKEILEKINPTYFAQQPQDLIDILKNLH